MYNLGLLLTPHPTFSILRTPHFPFSAPRIFHSTPYMPAATEVSDTKASDTKVTADADNSAERARRNSLLKSFASESDKRTQKLSFFRSSVLYLHKL